MLTKDNGYQVCYPGNPLAKPCCWDLSANITLVLTINLPLKILDHMITILLVYKS